MQEATFQQRARRRAQIGVGRGVIGQRTSGCPGLEVRAERQEVKRGKRCWRGQEPREVHRDQVGRAPEVSVVYTSRAWESKEEEGFQAKESRDWLCSGWMGGGGSGKQDEEEVARIMGRQQQLRSRKEVEGYEKLGGGTTRTWGSDGTWRGEVEERGPMCLPSLRLAGGVPYQRREPKRNVWGLGGQLRRRQSGGRDECPRALGLPVSLLRFLTKT